MKNWDERADFLRNEREAKEARKREAESDASAKERAELEPRYEILTDLARWVIRRYQTSNIPPIPIYLAWEEEVKVSRKLSRKEERTTQIGQAYKMVTTQHYEGDGHYSTQRFMVTPTGTILYVTDELDRYPRTWTHTPAGASRRHFITYIYDNEIQIRDSRLTSETASRSSLGEYCFLVENWQAMSIAPGGNLQPGSGVAFNKFCDEIASSVDRQTHS